MGSRSNQLLNYADVSESDVSQKQINAIPAWDSEQGLMIEDDGWTSRLEELGVFFSTPLDLDLMMMEAYPEAYKIDDEDLEEPDDDTLKAVLGKKHDTVVGQYSDEQQKYFDAYHAKFKLGSKPAWHIRAMASMEDKNLLDELPEVLDRMFDRIESELKDLPE